MIHRSISDLTELAYYRYHTLRATILTTLPRVTRHRWTVEECFQRMKNEAELDPYQVRF